MTSHCQQCGRSYGNGGGHCPTCCESFKSDAAFTRHRRRFTCLTIAEMEEAGMKRDRRGWWTTGAMQWTP